MSAKHANERTTITVLAAAGVVAALAVFNVAGWALSWRTSVPLILLFGAIAACSEILGFNLAISIERALARPRRFDRAAACLFSLAVCAAINVVSGHNAWTAFEREMFAPAVRAEQVEIDARRAPLQLTLEEANARARSANAQILAVAETGRLESWPGERVERQAAPLRAVAADAKAEAERLQSRLDAMPIVAAERHIASPAWVWAAFVLIEIMKATILWAIGAGLVRAAETAEVRTEAPPESKADPRPAQSPASSGSRPRRASPRGEPRPAKDKLAAALAHLRTVNARQAIVWRMRRVESRSVAFIAADQGLTERAVRAALRSADEEVTSFERASELEEQGIPVLHPQRATA